MGEVRLDANKIGIFRRYAPRSPTLVCRSITAMVRPCQCSSKAAISASKSGHRMDVGQ
jgi:hypothetical protein